MAGPAHRGKWETGMKAMHEVPKAMVEQAPQDTSVVILLSTLAAAIMVVGIIMLLFVLTLPTAALGG